jgi:hypothetical protein
MRVTASALVREADADEAPVAQASHVDPDFHVMSVPPVRPSIFDGIQLSMRVRFIACWIGNL